MRTCMRAAEIINDTEIHHRVVNSAVNKRAEKNDVTRGRSRPAASGLPIPMAPVDTVDWIRTGTRSR